MTATNAVTEPAAPDTASDTATANWRDWNPGLDTDEQSLQTIHRTLPPAGPDEIAQMVRLLENPASPYRAPTVTRLRRHDCLRILLGRGLLNQDEAFVLGYTMGTVKTHIDEEQVQLFRRAARLLYKPPYRMTENDLIAFDLAFDLASKSDYRHICRFDFDRAMDRDIGDLRNELGINVTALKAVFREERLRLPGDKASERLPVI